MTIRVPVGVDERDEEFLAWSAEDFVARMLENERREKGSIQRWMDSVHSDLKGVLGCFKAELQRNRVLAQQQLDRPVQILGTDEEAQAVLWTVHGRLLSHLPPRNVAGPIGERDDHVEIEHFISQGCAAA